MLFTHICAWYGNQDVFARMLKDMPPVFHTDYAAKQAERARQLATEETIDAWDLTQFLLPEARVVDDEEPAEVKVELDESTAIRSRCDSPMEERKPKRKRTKEG